MAREFALPTRWAGVIGAVLLAIVLWQAFDVASFLAHADRANGVIVDDQPHPTIQFARPDGQLVRFTQNGFVSRPPGSPIEVAYDPADPAGTAVADSLFPMWWTVLWPMPGMLLFLGTALAGHKLRFYRRGF